MGRSKARRSSCEGPGPPPPLRRALWRRCLKAARRRGQTALTRSEKFANEMAVLIAGLDPAAASELPRRRGFSI